ncbi:MAG: hypothetical protein HY220_02105 [Candidatus Sungbacteria bacterium]|uniref:Exosortase system-associated protein, TIGR04073 family n=1 Tax=Candidatus Sungiibacteriota bacterium TaxID=2750080 RepID=A0A9D6LRR5_9BACT|nr:hypothetical protein [Candidatus Sungbacteria bacterium]
MKALGIIVMAVFALILVAPAPAAAADIKVKVNSNPLMGLWDGVQTVVVGAANVGLAPFKSVGDEVDKRGPVGVATGLGAAVINTPLTAIDSAASIVSTVPTAVSVGFVDPLKPKRLENLADGPVFAFPK